MEKWKRLKIPLVDIKKATNNFRHTIGKGGYGDVYEGQLYFKGKYVRVAVKRLNEMFGQGLKEFLMEIDLLSAQRHQNVVTLVGYCDEAGEKIIVYEYAERGSLDQHIRKNTLTWVQRLKVLVDIAGALDHLHHHLPNNQVIIHRDVKSSNILIDQEWVGKISDLGLSRSTSSGSGRSDVISRPCGTPGYVEPEYITTGLVTKKSDVYSFGMVLFEVLCSKLCTDVGEDGAFMIHADKAKEHYTSNTLYMLIDPCLWKQMSPAAFERFSTIAYRSLLARKDRPLMNFVKKELEETLKIEEKALSRRAERSKKSPTHHYQYSFSYEADLDKNVCKYKTVIRDRPSGRSSSSNNTGNEVVDEGRVIFEEEIDAEGGAGFEVEFNMNYNPYN